MTFWHTNVQYAFEDTTNMQYAFLGLCSYDPVDAIYLKNDFPCKAQA